MSETIVNQRPDFPTAVVKFWGQRLLTHLRLSEPDAQPSDLPQHCPYFHILVGTEDFWKGYRQNHVSHEHEAVNIITFVHPISRRRIYAQLYGMPFGLASAVNQFNRAPQLLTAVARRVLLLICGHYFDDSIQFEYQDLAAQTKLLYVRFLQLFGVEISHGKRQPMTHIPKFLGQLTDLRSLLCDFTITMKGSPETILKAQDLIGRALQERCLSSGEASKLRGILTWLESTFSGKPLAGAKSALIARQYWDTEHELTVTLQKSLEILQLALGHLPPRTVHIFPALSKPVVVYTDASTEAPCPSGCRIGVWIHDGETIWCEAVDVPRDILAAWLPRKTQINLLELLAVPLVAHANASILKSRDVIWFLDNQAALGSLVKAASRQSDVNYLSLLSGLVFAVLGSRPWYEWVPSRCNISDPLSRLGLADPLVQTQLARGTWRRLNLIPNWNLLQPNLDSIATFITALGSKNHETALGTSVSSGRRETAVCISV